MASLGLVQSLIDQALTDPVCTGTGGLLPPRGTTAQRPASPTNGLIRYNSTVPQVEAYVGGAWTALAGGGAPVGAQFLVLALDGDLTSERTLGFNATNFTTSDGGANGAFTVNLVQNINSAASPTFAGLTLTGITASRLVASNGLSALAPVADLTAWITGTANRVTATSDGDGTITLSAPQDIHTAASPTFAGATISGLTATRLVASSAGSALTSVADLTAWITGTANRVTATSDGDGTITLSGPQDLHTGASPQFVAISLGTDNGAGFSPGAGTVRGLVASGTDLNGANVILAASTGTGTGNLGYLELQACGVKQATGTTAHVLTTFLTIGNSQSGHPGLASGGFMNFDGAFTDANTAASGTAAAWTAFMFRQPTLAATNASVTTTTASTIYIVGAPTAGANMTLVDTWALHVAAGDSRFGGAARFYNPAAVSANYGRGSLEWDGTDFWLHVDRGGSGTLPRLMFRSATTNAAYIDASSIWHFGGQPLFDAGLKLDDNSSAVLGASNDVYIYWSTAETNDALWVLISAGATSGASGNIIIQDSATAGNMGHAAHTDPHLYLQSGAGTGDTQEFIELFHDQTTAKINSGQGGLALQMAGTNFGIFDGDTFELEDVKTITGAVTDGYSAGLVLDPGYTAATAQTVTRHNYIDVQDVSVAGAGPAAVTDAAVLRFDAAIATHKALAAAFDTTDSGAQTTSWAGGIKVNVNGTLYKIPFLAA